MRAAFLCSVLLLSGAAAGQPASYCVFGTPCVPFLAFPYFVPQGVPKIGTTMRVSVPSSTPNSLSFFITGASNAQWNGFALPVQLVVPGFQPSCGLLRTSIELVQPVPQAAVVQRVPMPFAIPNDPALVGLLYFQQNMVLSSDPLNNFISFSAAGQAVIGN